MWEAIKGAFLSLLNLAAKDTAKQKGDEAAAKVKTLEDAARVANEREAKR